MGINPQCPRCGSNMAQLTKEESKHGCFYMFLFGIWYFMWIFIKWIFAFFLLVYFDWWLALICKLMGRGYVWKSKRLLSTKRRTYFCHNCGHNFKT